MAQQAPPIIVIKKIKKGHGHHGGAWKVAYADFVTAMMSLFMVLWLVSQTDVQTQSDISHYFRTGVFSGSSGVLPGSAYGIDGKIESEAAAPLDSEGEEGVLKKAAADSLATLARIAKSNPDAKLLLKNVVIKVTPDGLLIQILDSGEEMAFDTSSAELKPQLTEILKQLGPVLGQLPNKLQIHGHTDARPFPAGSGRTNWELSFQRADQARTVLEKSGVPDTQVAGVFAHGAARLLVPSDPLAAANRRLTLLAMRRGAEKENFEAKLVEKGKVVDLKSLQPKAPAPGDPAHEKEPAPAPTAAPHAPEHGAAPHAPAPHAPEHAPAPHH